MFVRTIPTPRWQIVAPDGSAADDLGGCQLDDGALRELYRLMVLVRRVDSECMNLHRQGELAAYPPATGQESAQVGAARAICDASDWIFPSYREQGMALVRDVNPVSFLLPFLLFHRGVWNGGMHDPRERGFAMICSSVGSHLLHAVGWAVGSRKAGRNSVALVSFGDGATSEGDAHEAFNFAGVFRAPVVFFCQNNQFAISTPYSQQTAAPVYEKARAYGFPGFQVDGHDVLAVYEACRQAAERARQDGGPTLIEALTYRVGPHNTSDDPSRYRRPEEVDRFLPLDPIPRYRAFLERTGRATAEFITDVEGQAARLGATLRSELLASTPRPLEEVFDCVFARMTPELVWQREEVLSLLKLKEEPEGTPDA